MATPVGGVGSTPLFGGLSGYKRDAPSKPTSVPGGNPAFRGKPNKPGSAVGAPSIRTSYNRQDQGTNVCIPYSRIVPLHHLDHVGRVQSGDVVFHSSYRVNRTYLQPDPRLTTVSMQTDRVATKMRLVGIDWLNKQLGGRPEYDSGIGTPDGAYVENWAVGENVILGTPVGTEYIDPVSDNVADEWRSLPVLREWVCDGVVLSNDEPYCHTGNGTNDSQLFNIAVQGVCALSNGYCDFKGDGVESAHRSFGATKDGYNDGGEPFVHSTFQSFGGEPFHHHYPLQMFDRKLRPMDTCFVGLVCTKRILTDAYRERLIRQTPKLQSQYDAHLFANPDDVAGATQAAIPGAVQSFYTFHYVCFSSNQAWEPRSQARYNKATGLFEGIEEMKVAQYGYADAPAKKATKHYEEAVQGETYDPFVGPSRREFEGMVGAWKVGQILDISAKKRDQYTGGPVDTTTAVTVNVNIEFNDWRALRRSFDRPDIGMRAPGARPWYHIELSGIFSERLGERAPGAVAAFQVAGLPSAEALRAAQSRYGDGYTNPADDGASQAEIDKHNAWMLYLKIHAHPRALFRLAANPGAAPMDDAAYEQEIADVLAMSTSSRDDERVFQWPTMYMPLLDAELTNIRTEMESDNDDRMREALVAYPRRNDAAEPRTASPFDDLFLQRDNVRYKLLMNLPIDPRTFNTLQDLIGPRDLATALDYSRAPLGAVVGAVIGSERRMLIRSDLYRREGYGNMPANRMLAEPYAKTGTGRPLLETEQYAFYPVGYRFYANGNELGVIGDGDDDNDYDEQMRAAYGSAHYTYEQSEEGHRPVFEAERDYAADQRQELFDLRNSPLTQLTSYQAQLKTARNLRIAGFGGGFRARMNRVSTVGLGRISYYEGATFSNGRVNTFGPVGKAMNALWLSIIDSARTVGEGVNGVVGLRGYLTWASQYPGFAAGGPAFGLAGFTVLRRAGMPDVYDVSNANPIPPNALLNEYPDGEYLIPDVDALLADKSWKSMAPGDNFFRAAALYRQGRELAGGVKAMVQFIDDYMAMHMLDGSPGMTKQDFIDWFTPPQAEELKQLVSDKMYLRADRASEQYLELIQSSLRFGPGQERVLRMVRDREGAAPARAPRSTGTPAAPAASSSSVEDVVMAPASTGKSTGKAPAKAAAKPPSRRRPVPPVPTAAPTAATAARSPAPPSLGTTPEHAAVTSLSAESGAGADLAAAVARSGRSPGTSPQHSPSVAAPTAAATTAPTPAAAAPQARPPARKRHATDAAGTSSGGQTSSLLSSIFGGSSGGSEAAPPAAAPTAAAPSNPLPSPSPSAASDEGASTGTGSSGRSRVRRPRDGR